MVHLTQAVLLATLMTPPPGSSQEARFQQLPSTSAQGLAAPSHAMAFPADTPVLDSLTLPDAVRIALSRNSRMAAARDQVAAADSRARLARAGRLPVVRAAGFASRYTLDQRLLPPSGPGQPMIYARQAGGGEVTLDVPLWEGGRLAGEVRAAERVRDARSHELERAGQKLEYDVASTFFGILRQRRVVESVRFSVEVLEAHERTVQELMEAGKAARVDVLRTRVRLADLRQRLLSEENRLEIEKKVLAYLLAWDPAEPLPPVGGELTLQPFDQELDAAVARALDARADVRAARAVHSAREQQVRAARAGRWPALRLQGSFSERWAISPEAIPEGANTSPTLGFVGVSASVPLFDGGRVSARVAEEEALLAAADQGLRDLRALVRLQVEETILTIRSARARIEATEASIQQGQETVRIEQEKYRLGKGSLTDMLDAQSGLLVAETAYYSALADYNTAIARYHLMAGEEIAW